MTCARMTSGLGNVSMVLTPLILHCVVFGHCHFPTTQVGCSQSTGKHKTLLTVFAVSAEFISYFFFYFLFCTHRIPLYHLYLELFSISYSLVETPVMLQQRWETGLTVESKQFSSGAPGFIACIGASFQLMCVPGVQRTSVFSSDQH